MTKTELIAIITERTAFTRAEVRLFMDKLNETLFETLADDQQVKIKGLGTFRMVSVKARKSVSVNGGDEIEIPAHNKITFTPDKLFAEMVNEPLSHLGVVELNDSQEETDGIAEEETDDFVPPARMKKLSEEAEELKGLLADINGLNTNTSVEETVVEEPVDEESMVEESVDEESVVEEPVEEEPIVEEPVHAENPVQPEPPVQPETPDQPEEPADNEDHDDRKPGMTHGGKIGRIFLLSMLLLLVVVAAFYWFNFKRETTPPEVEKKVAQVDNKTLPQSVDTLVSEPVDTVESTTAPAVNDKPAVKDKTAVTSRGNQPSVKMTIDQMRTFKVDYSVIQGTETVIDGSRLTMISLRAYGDKRFWVHIFLANRDQLSNPAQITTGMVIKIPKMDRRLIDASNPDCLQYAKELEAKYAK